MVPKLILSRVTWRSRITLLLWLIAGISGLFANHLLQENLSTSLSVPHSGSAAANAILSKYFGENIEGTFTVAYRYNVVSETTMSRYENEISEAAQVIPNSTIGQHKAIAGYLIENIDSSLPLSKAGAYVELFRNALHRAGLSGALVTGPAAIQHDVEPVLNADLHRGEALGFLIAAALLLILLGLSWQLLIPLFFGFAALGLTFDLLYLISRRFLVVLYVPNIVTLVGLGLAIDYSLLMIYRFRREIQNEAENVEAALIRTMASAGRTVRISGLTVAISLASLILVPVPFIRSIGFAVSLTAVVAVLAAHTLQPILLMFFYDARKPRAFTTKINHFGEFSTRRPRTTSTIAFAILMCLAFSVTSLHLTPSSLTSIPPQLESERAIAMISSAVGPGVVTPNELVIDFGSAHDAQSAINISNVNNLAKYLVSDPEISIVAKGTKVPYLDSTGRFARIFIVGRHSFGDPAAKTLVKSLRNLPLEKFGFNKGVRTYLAGAPAQGSDLLRALSRTIPWIAALVMLLTFIFLTRAFKSLLLPAKAILLDLISLAATLGILVEVFRTGWLASAFGLYHLNSIEVWAVILLSMLLYGISMDYEVFLLAGITEARATTTSGREAVNIGMRRNAMVVVAAALIFVGMVSGLAFSHFAGLQEVGIGLIFGAIVDVTLVRGLLLPALMVIFGRWNWWLPASLARLIGTSPAPRDEVRG